MKVSASIVVGIVLALSGAAYAQEKYSLSIATGGTGGVYYPIGGGLANLLSKYVPGMQATAEVTGGSVDNLKLIATGKPYIAFSMADAGQDAYRGEDKFKGTKVPLRTFGELSALFAAKKEPEKPMRHPKFCPECGCNLLAVTMALSFQH